MPKRARPTQKKIRTKKCPHCGEATYLPEGPGSGDPTPLTKVRAVYVRPRELNEPRVIEITIMASTEKYIAHKEVCSEQGGR